MQLPLPPAVLRIWPSRCGRNRVVIDQHGGERWRHGGRIGGVSGAEVVARHMLRTDREFYPLFKSESPAPTRQ